MTITEKPPRFAPTECVANKSRLDFQREYGAAVDDGAWAAGRLNEDKAYRDAQDKGCD
jgi:hypothetical protein